MYMWEWAFAGRLRCEGSEMGQGSQLCGQGGDFTKLFSGDQ